MLSEEQAIAAYEHNNPTDDHATGVIEVCKAQIEQLRELGWRSGEEVDQASREERVKILDWMYEHSTAPAADNPWDLIAITLTKDMWEALKSGKEVK